MDKIKFDSKIQNLYSADYEYLQDSIDDELKKIFRQGIQNPGVPAIIKGFDLKVSPTDTTKMMIYHDGDWGGLVSVTGEIVETQLTVDLIAPSDSTVGTENYIYIRIYTAYGTYDKTTETVEEGVQASIDLYDYSKQYDRELVRWEVKVYTQAEVLALTQAELDELVPLGSFTANGTSPIEAVSESGRVFIRSFIQEGSIQSSMISSTGFLLPQHNVEASDDIDDTFSGTPTDLEEDLNKIRRVLKETKGTATWDEYISNSLLDSDSSANKLHGNGVIRGEWEEFEVLSNSTGLSVIVQAGKALVQGDVAHILSGQTEIFQLEDQVNYQVGDWDSRVGEEHVVGHNPVYFDLDFANVGNLLITDKFNEPYPGGFREGVDYTVDYELGRVYVPDDSRICGETVKCFYEYGFTRYDIIEIGEDSTIRVVTGTAEAGSLPPDPTDRYLLLYQIKVDPFDTTVPAENLIDARTYAQYVRNLHETSANDLSIYDYTVNKITYLTSTGDVDEALATWTVSSTGTYPMASTSTGDTRVLSTISCLDDDELWLMVDKTPYQNDVVVEIDPFYGYQEFGMSITGSDPSGLASSSDYWFKLNGIQYKITTSTNLTYTAVVAAINSTIESADFSASIVGGDIRISDAVYTGMDSTVEITDCTAYTGDLFHNLTGFTSFDTAVDGLDAPPTSGHQEVGLDIDSAAASGLSANTSYYFTVNGTVFTIKTGTSLTLSDIATLMNTALSGSGFTAAVVSNVEVGETEEDIRVTNTATGSSSTVTLGFYDGNLVDHLTGFTALESSVDLELASWYYTELDLSWNDRIEYYPVFIKKGITEGFHKVRLTVSQIRDTFVFYSVVAGKMDIYYSKDLLYGAPEAEPYKVNNLRGVYPKLYVEPTNSRKARIYLSDEELCTSTGYSLNYWDIEQQYPVSRVDQSLTVGGGTARDVTDSVDPLPEDTDTESIIFFTPSTTLLAAEQHQRCGFYLSAKGDDWPYLSCRIHDASHTEVGSVDTKLFADTSTGWNYFEIDVDLTPGVTYHYHVVVHSRVGNAPKLQTQVTTDSINYIEMYKPYAGLYDDNDVPILLNSSGSRVVAVRTSTGDASGSRHDQATLDIMGVDLSNDSTWDTWEYETYIGVDLATGRMKFPSGYDANDYWIEFNHKKLTTETDTKGVLLHGETVTVEDTLHYFTHDARYTIMRATGSITTGNLVTINSSTGWAETYSASASEAHRIVGVCIGEPEINKLGYPNPVKIATSGLVLLNVSTGTFNVGDALYAALSDGSIIAHGSYTAGDRRLGVIIEIVDANSAIIFMS